MIIKTRRMKRVGNVPNLQGMKNESEALGRRHERKRP
jgi:hypothetical protein